MALNLGQPHQRKDLIMGHRGNPRLLGWSLGGVMAATVGAYSGSTSEAAHISDGDHSLTTANLCTHAVSPQGLPPVQWSGSTTGREVGSAAVIGCERPRRLAPKVVDTTQAVHQTSFCRLASLVSALLSSGTKVLVRGKGEKKHT